MAQHAPSFDQREQAREHTKNLESLLSGSEQGATKEIEKMSLEAESELKKRYMQSGSRAAGHAADVLKVQRELITSKDLGDRFLRIANRLEELRRTSVPGGTDISQLQRNMESLRPLLRLLIRSDEFRKTLLTALEVAKHVVKENSEGSAEDVIKKGQQQGVDSAQREAKQQVSQTAQNIQKKMESKHENLIPEDDWNKLSEQLDSLFNKLQSHSEFRDGIEQLFNLASYANSQLRMASAGISMGQNVVEEMQQEAKELVAQFSGDKALDRLGDSLKSLNKKLENNSDAQKWWSEFKEHILRLAKNYQGRKDIDKFRDLFQRGYNVFQDVKDELDSVIDRLNDVVNNIANDELVNKLRESLSALSDDLFWQDKDGNRYFDADAGGVLASSVSDVIRNQFSCLALPRISRVEENMSYTLDNLCISATLPDKIDFHLESFASLDTSALSVPGKSSLQTEIYLTATIRGITARAPDISFTYQGSTLSESGIMSITIPEPGADLSLDFVMRPVTNPAISSVTAPTSTTTTHPGFGQGAVLGSVGGGGFMRYDFVKVKSHFAIPDMIIDFDNKTLSHNFLVPLITNVFKARIIDRFESGVEESLDKTLVNLGQQITSILNQAPNPLSISSFGSLMTAV